MSKLIEDHIIENLVSIHPLLSKSFSKVRTKTNFNPGTLIVLGILVHHGKLSMSEIGRKLSMPKPHVTVHINQIISKNMAERVYDPQDRRIINIMITPEGIKQFDEAKRMISREVRKKLQLLNNEERQILLDASETVYRLLYRILMEDTDEKCIYKKEK